MGPRTWKARRRRDGYPEGAPEGQGPGKDVRRAVEVADALVALGGAFLAAGLLARIGRRIELPTIPLFMVAGIIFGPET